MAVGDVVSGIFTTIHVYHTFQPAVGVEIMITFMGGRGTNTYGGIDNSVNYSNARITDSADYSEGFNTKVGITNTNYLTLHSDIIAPSYSGIQIK